MKNTLIVFAVLILAALAYYLLVMRPSATEVDVLPPVLIEQPVAVAPTEPDQPLREALEPEFIEDAYDYETEQPALLTPAESDTAVLESVSELIGETVALQQVVTENIISRVVATIDALTGRQLPGNLLPVQSPGGALEVTEDTNPANPMFTPEGDPLREYLVDPVNYQRYTPDVELLESVNTEELLATYLEYQPLLQQAFVELGYPQGDFNQRLLDVIDHLLDAPNLVEPVRLVKPEAYYLFADPQLEALTAGQKLMIRMGSSNAQRVKVKLAEFRTALVASSSL